MKKNCWMATFGLVLSVSFCSASFASDQIELAPLLHKIIGQHPEIRAAQAERDALLLEIDQDQAWQNPEFELGVGQKNDGSRSGIAFETVLTQRLAFPGKLDAKKKAAIASVTLQTQEIHRIKLNLWYDATIAAYELESAVRQVDINQRRGKRLTWIKQYLTSRPLVSPQKQLESRLIESHLKRIQIDTLHLNAQKESSRVVFQAIIGQPIAHVSLPPIPLNRLDFFPSHNVSAQNPNILKIRAQLAQIESETRVLEWEDRPDFNLSGKYASESATETEQILGLGIAMDLPFSSKNRLAVQAQNSRKKGVEAQMEHAMTEAEVRYQTARLTLQQSQDVLTIVNPNWLNQLEHSVEKSIEDFKKGQTDLRSVLDLESQWVAAAQQKFDAEEAWITAWATLMQLNGVSKLPGDSL